MSTQKQKNPASVFLTLAMFNGVGGIAFVVFYFFYKSSGGENSYYMLIAAGAAFAAAIGSLVAYRIFKAKLEGLGRK